MQIFEREGETASVDATGYVDFDGCYDKQYKTQDAAISDLEERGWEWVGAEDCDVWTEDGPIDVATWMIQEGHDRRH